MNSNSYSTESLPCTNRCVRHFDHQRLPVNLTRRTPRLAGICIWLAALPLIRPAALSAQPQAGIIGYSLPNAMSHPNGITAGPDGALWFTEFSSNRIGRITTAGAIAEYPVPSGPPEVIAVAADGALWFTEYDSSKIGRITTNGVITEYPVPSADSHPGITKGPDGALWFTEDLGNKIARINLTGAVSEYTVPTAESFPSGITAGPDGALWFSEYGANKIGRISTAGVFSEYLLPDASSGPTGIATGPDGALWFTEYAGNKIGRITTTGVITEYPLPAAFSLPSGITAGPDAAVWFTEFDGNRIGRITTDGVVSEYPVPTPSSGPWAITAGPDDALWFTGYDGNRIGQVVLPTAVLTASPNTGVPGAGVTYTGSGFAANEIVKLYANSTGTNLIGAGIADGTGSLLISTRAFLAPYGYNAVVGVGQSSGALGFTPFTIQARLIVRPKTAPAGATGTAYGLGFAAGERVDVYWNSPRRLLGEATADSQGSFEQDNGLSFTVPTNASQGKNWIYGVGQSSGTVVYNFITVE